jgi:N-acyl-L-homoserine lactone synthetase
MIEVVTPDAAFRYRDKIYAMHCLRHRVFKERLHWEVCSRDGVERDVFDLFQPIYLLATDDLRNVTGTWRLLPTTGPYMLRDVFPELLDDQPPPKDPAIWETSRFAVEALPDSAEGLGAVSRITCELFCGLIEFCLLFGIREIITVYDIRIARLLPRIGCRPNWQGSRHRLGETLTLAGRFDITPEVLGAIQTAGKITGSVLHADILSEQRHAA